MGEQSADAATARPAAPGKAASVAVRGARAGERTSAALVPQLPGSSGSPAASLAGMTDLSGAASPALSGPGAAAAPALATAAAAIVAEAGTDTCTAPQQSAAGPLQREAGCWASVAAVWEAAPCPIGVTRRRLIVGSARGTGGRSGDDARCCSPAAEAPCCGSGDNGSGTCGSCAGVAGGCSPCGCCRGGGMGQDVGAGPSGGCPGSCRASLRVLGGPAWSLWPSALPSQSSTLVG